MAEINRDLLKRKIDQQARKVLEEVERIDLYGTLAFGVKFEELETERKKALSHLYNDCIKIEYLVRRYKDTFHSEIYRYNSLEEKISNIVDSLLEHIVEIRTIDASG